MMEFLGRVLLALLCLHLSQADRIVDNFIREHFAAAYIHHINIFACYDHTDAVTLSRNVMKLDNAVTYHSISSDLNFHETLRFKYYHIGIVLDFDCLFSHVVLDKFSRDLAFNESYTWLLLTNLSSLPVYLLENLPLTVASEFTFAIRSFDEFELYDVYNPSYAHGGNLNITYKGHWSEENGYKNELTQFKYKRRADLNLIPLNCSVVLRFPPPLPELENYLSIPENRHIDTLSRYHWLLAMHLKDLFNFSVQTKVYDSWGHVTNGTYSGVVGSVIAGETDLGVSNFRFNGERLGLIKHTVETLNVELRWFFLHPRSNDLENNFVKPFEMSLWYTVLLVATIFWILMIIIYHFEMGLKETKEKPYVETALITVAALSQQGVSDGTIFFSNRMILLTLFLWSMFLYEYYCACILGFILTPPKRWITTVKNLSDSNLESAVEATPYMVDWFATSRDPPTLEIYDVKVKPSKKKPQGSWMTAVEGFQRVRKGGFAFHLNIASAYKMIEETFEEDEVCELQQIDMCGPVLCTMITPMNSPFNEMFVWGLRKMVEGGLTKRHYKIWHHRCPQCPEGHSSKPTPVTVQQFSPAIFLLLIGNGVACVLGIFEYFYAAKYIDNSSSNEDTDESIAQASGPDDIDDDMILTEDVKPFEIL